MKRNFCNIGFSLLLILLTMASYSCSTGRYLRTESATGEEITGVYTLIIYGGASANDTRTLAILAKEGTPYSFEVFQPEFEMKIIKGVPAREALEKARKSFTLHPDFS
jgi:hypothetical protein